MKRFGSGLVLAVLCLVCVLPHAFADGASQVVISDVPADAESAPLAVENEDTGRAKGVSAYGAVAPVQIPVTYAGKAFDALVTGTGKVLMFPFEFLSRKSKHDNGGQNGQEKN